MEMKYEKGRWKHEMEMKIVRWEDENIRWGDGNKKVRWGDETTRWVDRRVT